MLLVPPFPEGCRRPRSRRVTHPPPHGMPKFPLLNLSVDVVEKKSDQHDEHDACNTKVSRGDCREEGKLRRKRKMKLHFDELVCPEKPARKVVRRLRIMRYLGLIAPVGSPFSVQHDYSC